MKVSELLFDPSVVVLFMITRLRCVCSFVKAAVKATCREKSIRKKREMKIICKIDFKKSVESSRTVLTTS